MGLCTLYFDFKRGMCSVEPYTFICVVLLFLCVRSHFPKPRLDWNSKDSPFCLLILKVCVLPCSVLCIYKVKDYVIFQLILCLLENYLYDSIIPFLIFFILKSTIFIISTDFLGFIWYMKPVCLK